MRYCVLFIGLIVTACHSGPGDVLGAGANYYVGAGYPRSFRLPDGSTVRAMPNTGITTSTEFGKKDRDMSVDGEAIVEVSGAQDWPFVIHTRDLVIEVLEGGSRFHVAARRSTPGEEVDLIQGRLRVRKSYHSNTDNEPEELAGGEMVMVNRDIDLMEKEKLAPAELDKIKARQ